MYLRTITLYEANVHYEDFWVMKPRYNIAFTFLFVGCLESCLWIATLWCDFGSFSPCIYLSFFLKSLYKTRWWDWTVNFHFYVYGKANQVTSTAMERHSFLSNAVLTRSAALHASSSNVFQETAHKSESWSSFNIQLISCPTQLQGHQTNREYNNK